MSEWISVTRNLPKVQNTVFVYINGEIEKAWVGRWSNGYLQWIFSNPDIDESDVTVTHWMTLPEPPK